MKGDIKNEATVVYHFSCFSLILHHSLHLLAFHPHSPLYCLFRHYASWSYNIIDKMPLHLHCTLPTLFVQIALFQPLHFNKSYFLEKDFHEFPESNAPGICYYDHIYISIITCISLWSVIFIIKVYLTYSDDICLHTPFNLKT